MKFVNVGYVDNTIIIMKVEKKGVGIRMKKNKSMCNGCRNNRFNFQGLCERPGIDAVVTSKQCWSFKDARIEHKKRVSVSQVPPFKQKKQLVLSCMQEPGYAYVNH